MAINNIAILGNTLEAKLEALTMHLGCPNVTTTIYTNGQEYENHVMVPIQYPMCCPGTRYLNEYIGIKTQDLFENTNTTVAMGQNWQHNDNGIVSNVYITMVSNVFPLIMTHYQCIVKGFHVDADENEQIRLFFEWMKYKYPNEYYSILDIWTWFSAERFHNTPSQEHFFNMENAVINSAPDYGDFNWAHAMPTCYDLDGIVTLLDARIAELNISIVTDAIESFTIEQKSPDLGAGIREESFNWKSLDTYEEQNFNDDLFAKDWKNITHLTIGGGDIEVDFVIDTGCNHAQMTGFIESDEDLTEINSTMPWTQYREYESSRHDMSSHAVYQVDGIPNGARVHEVYRNKTMHKEFQITDSNCDSVTGSHAGEFLAGGKDNIKTVSLSGRNVQDRFIINDKYNSNYIRLDIKRQGLNPVMHEELSNVFNYAYMCTEKLTNCIADPDNSPMYLSSAQYHYRINRDEFKQFAYYVWDNNTIGPGWEWANSVPSKYKNLFDSWNGDIPKVPHVADYLGHSLSSTFVTKYGNSPGGSNSPSRVAWPYLDLEYTFIAEARGKITKDFSNKFIGYEDIFEDIRLLSIMLKSKFYEFGTLTFEEFRAKHLVGEDSLTPITANHILLEDGTGKLLTRHKYIQIKEYTSSEDSTI